MSHFFEKFLDRACSPYKEQAYLTNDLCRLIWNQAPFSLALFEWSDAQHDWLCLSINPAGFAAVEERLKPGSWLSVEMPYHLDPSATNLDVPLVDYYYQILQGGIPRKTIIVYANGELQNPVYWNYTIPLDNGRVFMFFLDISEQSISKAAVEQGEEVARSFGSVIAHSLNNFTVDERSICRRLERSLKSSPKTPKEIEEAKGKRLNAVAQLRDVSQRRDTLLKGLRQVFSTLQTPIKLEPIKIADILILATESYSAEFEVTGDLDALAWGTEVLLQECARLLISNAIKFAGSGKTDARWQITDTHSVRGIRVELIDTGVGFDPTQEHRLFQQVHGQLHNVEGSGVGLYTVRKTIERLNAGMTRQLRPYGAMSDGINGASFWFELRKAGSVNLDETCNVETSSLNC